jgi:hypothetical protein
MLLCLLAFADGLLKKTVICRAIQLGMKGRLLENFGKQQVRAIEDITDLIKQQGFPAANNEPGKGLVPIETIYSP